MVVSASTRQIKALNGSGPAPARLSLDVVGNELVPGLFLCRSDALTPARAPVNLNVMNVESQHRDLPWRVHELAHDFILLDVWEVQLTPSPGAGFLDFQRLAANMGTDFGGATGFLMRVRGRLGKWFGWDAHNHTLPIPGCVETSVAARLTDEDRRRQRSDGPRLPQGQVDDLRPIYLYEDESLQELSNRTIHALLHMSWVPGETPVARLAIYVKHRGLKSRLYMGLIKPFRHAIVYPAWIRHIQRAWSRQHAETGGPA